MSRSGDQQSQQSLGLKCLSAHLKSVVEWKPVEENIREELAQAEDTIHHPVRQPFCVVFFARTFNGFDSADARGNKLSECL